MFVFVLVVPFGFAGVTVVTAVVSVAAVAAIVIIIAVSIADSAACSAAYRCTDQPTGAASDPLTNDIAARCAQAATDGPLRCGCAYLHRPCRQPRRLRRHRSPRR